MSNTHTYLLALLLSFSISFLGLTIFDSPAENLIEDRPLYMTIVTGSGDHLDFANYTFNPSRNNRIIINMDSARKLNVSEIWISPKNSN
jgi:hypothetical protein